ncbi:Nn.00g003550.m01.CDS01 [Neocucurbitaria sp. VM-36]
MPSSSTSTSTSTSPLPLPAFPATPYTSKYNTWPYTPTDFQRYDEHDDKVFYQHARLVTHIDDPAITRLTAYYDTVLPRSGRIMDMCTSWKSFYPRAVEEAVRREELDVYGVGLNAEEMKRNDVLREGKYWRVMDLNRAPHDVRGGWGGVEELEFDAVTCVVSIDYLVAPLEVCKNLLDATKEGGRVHLVISNRCFPNKVVRRWLMLGEQARLEMVGDYLHFAGWNNVEIVDLCARDEQGGRVTDDQGTVLVNSPSLPNHLDPLWVVRGTKAPSK